MNESANPWITVFAFDGEGGGENLDTAAYLEGSRVAPAVWIELDRGQPEAHRWIREESGLSSVAIEALLAEASRPRCLAEGDGVLLNLRGVNLNPGADPDDMVSIRIWAEPARIITVRRRNLKAVQDIRDSLEQGAGPGGASEFLVCIADRLIERMSQVIHDLNDRADQLEGDLLSTEHEDLRARLRALRGEAIGLRRYIAPQRDALSSLVGESIDWLRPLDRQLLRGVMDRQIRYIEDLDVAREKAALVQDELASILSEQTNKNMYLLAIVAGVFLPLTLITGLLGINVAGIPGAGWPGAFAAVTGMLVLVGAIELFLLRRLRWF